MSHEPLTNSPVIEGPQSRAPFRWAEGCLAALCLFLFFFRLGSVRLFDLDEALYVTCARQMLVTGDWVTPRLNARPPARPEEPTSPFFEKPILVYWCAAFSMRLFGGTELAARLPAATAALFTTGLLYGVGRRWFGRRAGLLAAALYATAPMTLADARQMTTDGLLVLWVTIALLAFDPRGPTPEADRPPAWLSFLCFWTACALAVLTKGAIGLLIPGLVIGVYLLLDRLYLRLRWGEFAFRIRWNRFAFIADRLRPLRPLLGMALAFILAAPWHYFVWKAGEHGPDGRTFVQEYIIHQHIGRFQGADTVHNMPLPTYILYFLLGFFPWACFAPAAFRMRYRGEGKESTKGHEGNTKESHSISSVVKYLLVWFWAIFGFYSLSAAKLPTYIVPAYPAAALLIGRWLDRAFKDYSLGRSLQRGTMAATVTSSLLFAAALLLPHVAARSASVTPEVVQLARHLTGALFVGCLTAFLCIRCTKFWEAGVLALVGTMALVIGIGVTEGYTVVERAFIAPYQEIAEDARTDAKAGIPVVFYHIIPRRPSMLYYARDYSPLERKELLVLPTARSLVSNSHREVDVITTQDVLDKELNPEVAVSPGVSLSLISHRQGWLLLRLHLP